MNKCIFLDKDGTIIYDVPYNVTLTKIKLYEDVLIPLQYLAELNYKFVIISNQSGIARGYFDQKDLHLAMDYLVSLLIQHGIYIAGYYYCPHSDQPELNTCKCRKPSPGLIFQAAEEQGIDLGQSWMIGDILADVGAGNAAGCNTILLDRNGRERFLPKMQEQKFRPDHIASNFYEAINTIIAYETRYEHTDKNNTRTI